MRNEQFSLHHSQPMSFAELVKLLLHHRWQIISLTTAVAVMTLLRAYTEVPLYKASSTILIEPRLNQAVQVREVYDPGVGTVAYYATQIEIIRSRPLARKVAERLKLAEQPADDDSGGRSLFAFDWRKWLPMSVEQKLDQPGQADIQAPQSAAEKLDAVASTVMRNTIVEAVPRTQLLRVTYVSSSTETAAKVADALSEAYIEYGLESRLEASRKATKWLTEKLSELRATLEGAEKNLQAFRDREQLVNVGGARALVEEELVDGTKRLREAQRVRTQLAATYRQILQSGTDPARLEQISDLIKLPLVQSAKANLLAAQENLKQLQQRYGEKHPQISGAQTRMQSAEKTFRDQLLLAAQNFRNEFEVAQQSESTLSGGVASARDRIRDLDRKQYELGVLQREVSSNEQLYNLFLSSFKEADTSSSYEPINARVIESAQVPKRPFSPDFLRLAIQGLVAGLLLSLLLVAIRQLLDESVRSAEELEAVADLTVMGVLPRVGGIGRRKNMVEYFCSDARTAFAEGVRSVRASVQLNDVDKRYRKIMITSTVPGEGKSSLASCLAMAFASSERVLLVEGDMRAPSLKKIFGLPKSKPGLLEVLSGEVKFEDAVHRHEPSKVDLLVVARQPSSPAEVINSAAFAHLLQTAAATYERVIIDSPPCQAASDSLVLAKLADAVIFTVKADETRRRAVTNAVKQLRNVQASLLGAVINQVSARRNPNYADNYYYAKGYYG